MISKPGMRPIVEVTGVDKVAPIYASPDAAQSGRSELPTAGLLAQVWAITGQLEQVRGCDVYVGLVGLSCGSLVRDRLQVSYTELEFDKATEAGIPRLMFLLDAGAELPVPGQLVDLDPVLQDQRRSSGEGPGVGSDGGGVRHSRRAGTAVTPASS